MYVEMTVPVCDFTGESVPSNEKGAGLIARSAAGRYCVVMFAGPKHLQETGAVVYTHEEAVAKVEKAGDGYVDF